MPKDILNRPFYPFLLCVYPITFLYARNIEIFAAGELARPLLASAALTGLSLLAWRLVLKNWHKAALLTTLLLALFFGFGHAVNLLTGWAGRVGLPLTAIHLAWVWLAALLALPLLVIKARRPERAAVFLNVLGLSLVFFNLASILSFWAFSKPAAISDEAGLLARLRGDPWAGQPAAAAPAGPRPDVYYIILDSYERADALQTYYHFDNTDFIQALEARGFYVAGQSRANYQTTIYSLPSSLNLIYLNDLPRGLFTKITAGLDGTFAEQFLAQQGYQTVGFDSGYVKTTPVGMDLYESPFAGQTEAPPAEGEAQHASQFELLLVQTSIGRLLYEMVSPQSEELQSQLNMAIKEDFQRRRETIQYAFAHLDDYAAADGPHFVFAHIITPHNPYLYDAAGGETVYNGDQYLLGDKKQPERDIALYTGQLQYVNRLTLDLIDRILAQSDTPPVIILQADHGHDTLFEWESSTREGVDLRTAILNAYYFPDGTYQRLYPSISPVNTFRVVFNQYFGTRFDLLPDQAYLHPHPNGVPAGAVPELVDICARYSICSTRQGNAELRNK